MSLMSCPECGKEISDKSQKCIHCGFPIIQENVEENQTQQVEITSVNIRGNNIKKTISSVLILFVVIVVGLFIYNTVQQKTAEAKLIEETNIYIDNLNDVRSKMLLGASEGEIVADMIRLVWYNAIYDEIDVMTITYTAGTSDFNEALYNYRSSDEYNTYVSSITNNQTQVAEMMKKLQNPPQGLEKAYDTVSDLYSAYSSVCKNATDPSGNLNSYTESVNTSISDFTKYYDALETQIPEKIE